MKEGEGLDDPNMLLNVFLAFLLKAVNCAFTDGKEKLSYYDIEICLKTHFWLHFYRCSPTALLDKKVRKAYGPASDLSEELWKMFMKGISYDTEGQHYGAHFKSWTMCSQMPVHQLGRTLLICCSTLLPFVH